MKHIVDYGGLWASGDERPRFYMATDSYPNKQVARHTVWGTVVATIGLGRLGLL